MKTSFAPTLALLALVCGAVSAHAQAPRQDVIWARVAPAITLDGNLNEPAWLVADSVQIRYGISAGIPGSGWKPEAGILPSDSTKATLRFLVVGNQLYLGAQFRDKSVGGSKDFNRFDGLLMAIKDHLDTYRPAPPSEYFYSWWYPELTPPADTAPGLLPDFRGRWTNCGSPVNDCTVPRTQEQISAWDARTVVHGISNDDNNVDGNPSDDNDWGYVVEMRFDLSVMGYNVTQPAGDIVEWNISIYDSDWLWPFQPTFSANRVWWQNPWGNAAWFHNVRIYARPNVTTASGPAPAIGPELRIRSAGPYAAPAIDGLLSDPVWAATPSFDIRFGDDALRSSYDGVGPYRSGQYQPEVNGGLAFPLDPGDATVRMFYKGDLLYLGFDVRDQVVQYVSNFDRWDGFIVTLTEYSAKGTDQQLLTRRISFQVGPTGQALAQDYLPFLKDTLGGAQVALQLKPGTTLDTLGQAADAGYTAELSIDLKKLGYPAGRGDGRIFLGINLLDGDSWTPFTDSYGTRTWWYRQYEGEDGAAWGYLDPLLTVDVNDLPVAGRTIELLGNRPNPYREQTTIQFTLDRPRTVTLQVFDLLGRRVAEVDHGLQPAGPGQLSFRRDRLSMAAGLYHYRLRLGDEGAGSAATLAGKMIIIP